MRHYRIFSERTGGVLALGTQHADGSLTVRITGLPTLDLAPVDISEYQETLRSQDFRFEWIN